MKVSEIFENLAEPINVTNKNKVHRFYDQVIEQCSIAVKHFLHEGECLYRGEYTNSNLMIWQPSDNERPAANFDFDYYKYFFNQLPSWQEAPIPNRSRSIICSPDGSYSSGFGTGDVYAVFPVDAAIMGIAPDYDFWGSRVKHDTIMTPELEQTTNYKSYMKYSITSSQPMPFTTYLRILEEYTEGQPKKIIPTLKELGIFDKVNEAFNPYAMGIRAVSTQQFYSKFPQYNNEVWTSDKCFGIQNVEDFIRYMDEPYED